jgi:hypothetical protein
MASIVVSTGGTRSFYAVNTDHLGSIRLLTDAGKNLCAIATMPDATARWQQERILPTGVIRGRNIWTSLD